MIVALHRRDWDQFAIGIARMVHEAGDVAELLSIHHVLALAGPIKAEQVRLVLLRAILANACLLLGDDFAQVSIDELSLANRVRRAKTYSI